MAAVPIHPGLFTMPGDPRGPRLLAGRCAACGRHSFPAAATCPYCTADGCQPVPVGAHGSLYLWTVVNARPPGYRGEVPYGFGIVELPEGLRVVGRIDETDLDVLRPGLRLELAIAPLYVNDAGDEVLSFSYRPAGGRR
ncbi:MAG: OB-fold domain-containing protein [Thermodesulfobacteriota bacterium]